ncbi:molybdopterin cofactor-binding domain-containing protein [Blastomonas sp.]|uniref:xanthine dehydrogenase family protein molybdopterin-binding subunit n=1 Tax=Blastomonas sp. TaxID=1909299 RepID=UPI00260A501D|nr:molybdopterin cofactor-binding domain-containing protein [Blastomonas sp.]MDM7956184.1 molybdopterin-dependent oxidoreductase [Blastomonas sp.]
MADNPTPHLDMPIEAAPPKKKKGMVRRAFLVGSALLVGGGVFGVYWSDSSARARAKTLTETGNDRNFLGWMKIAEDDTVTVYSPHIDFGQGSHTALGQMLADELDADWSKVRVEQAPADTAFANTPLGKGFLAEMSGAPGVINALPGALIAMIARSLPLQITGGSSAVRYTGQVGMRTVGAAVRLALIEEAADRLGVPTSELTTADSKVIHAKSGKALRYGELAAGAAERSLSSDPVLKTRDQFTLIGKPVPRLDIPAKVDGSAVYGIDLVLPEMRVATIAAAPVRGGKLLSVDEKPALAVTGLEKVIKLDDAVIVVAKRYWQAQKGLKALSPQFSDGGHGNVSSASIYSAQEALRKAGKPENEGGEGDVDAAFGVAGAKTLTAEYRVPFLHHAMMEPFALTGHYAQGKLTLWGGLQDPLSTRARAAKAAGIAMDDVVFNPMIMGGGFGRRFPDMTEIIDQVALLAKQVPYPVKLIWSREEEVRHGTYRPQSSAQLKATLGQDGRISAWRTDYVQSGDAEGETSFIYAIPATSRRHFSYQSNQMDGPWRSVNSTQIGFCNESFIDELAHSAGEDPYQFRRKHLPAGSRHLKVLDTVAQRAGWGSPLPEGVGRGIAIVESFGTIVAEVIEASVREDGSPKVLKAWAVVDCGTTVNPLNAEAQIAGGLIMGLSSAIGEAITLDKGAVVQSNFNDYNILKLADAPPMIDVHFLESGAKIGGIGEPGVPPASPALANALFAATGKRIRTLPILTQAKA